MKRLITDFTVTGLAVAFFALISVSNISPAGAAGKACSSQCAVKCEKTQFSGQDSSSKYSRGAYGNTDKSENIDSHEKRNPHFWYWTQ